MTKVENVLFDHLECSYHLSVATKDLSNSFLQRLPKRSLRKYALMLSN